MFKHTPVNASGVGPLDGATELRVSTAKPTKPTSDALATIVEYVLLTVVGVVVIAITLYVLKDGMTSLVGRVGELLAPR